MLYSLILSFLYQCDKEAVLLWTTGIIPLESLYSISSCQTKYYLYGCTLLITAIHAP